MKVVWSLAVLLALDSVAAEPAPLSQQGSGRATAAVVDSVSPGRSRLGDCQGRNAIAYADRLAEGEILAPGGACEVRGSGRAGQRQLDLVGCSRSEVDDAAAVVGRILLGVGNGIVAHGQGLLPLGLALGPVVDQNLFVRCSARWRPVKAQTVKGGDRERGDQLRNVHALYSRGYRGQGARSITPQSAHLELETGRGALLTRRSADRQTQCPMDEPPYADWTRSLGFPRPLKKGRHCWTSRQWRLAGAVSGHIWRRKTHPITAGD